MDYQDVLAGRHADIFWFQARNKLIDVLLKRTGKTDAKILNIGGGTGDNLGVIAKYGKVYIIDVNSQALELVPEGLYEEKKVSDACALDYPDNFFDLVVSFDVFEHIEDDVQALAEVRRVLKPGGILVFTVPAFPFLFSSHDIYLQHYRRYTRKTLHSALHQFSDVRLNYWNAVLFIPNVIIRLVEKSRKKPASELRKNYYHILPRFIDRILYYALCCENVLIRFGIPLPFGVSLVGTARNEK